MEDYSQDTPETAAVKLAERLVKGREKRAFGMSDVSGFFNPGGTPDPTRWLAAGAGLGGLAGLASSYGRDEEERRPFSSAITGALAGGAALGGGALVAPQLQSVWSGLKNRLPAAPAAGAGAATPPAAALSTPPAGLSDADLRAWVSNPANDASAKAWLENGATTSQRAAIQAGPSWWEQHGDAVTGTGERYLAGHAVGAAGESLGRSLVNPLGRGAAAMTKDTLPPGADNFMHNNVSNADQLKSLWGAMKGRGSDPNILAAESEGAAGLTNTGVRNMFRAGARTPFQAIVKSGPGVMLGGLSAAAPWLMGHAAPVTPQELAR